jgi:hypothetical protein
MALSRVDLNRKQAKSSFDHVEEGPFCFDRLAITVSAPSQAMVHLAKMIPQDLFMNVLMGEMHGNFQFQIWFIR